MTERQIEAAFVKAVKAAGGLALKLVSPGMAGAPDRLALLPGGRVLFAEIKRPGGTLRPFQRKRQKQIAALGFRALVIDGTGGLSEVLKHEV
jgi:hypothetical protein